ncbi:hypothetical protein HY256_04575, partial [Candidatus Sumerlaeota bacterium]|nr:hypothetical protein [Candidatus Sumerlaeota bacterium]
GGGPNLDRTGLTAPVESLPVSMIAPKERTPAESPIPAVTAEGTKRILAEGGELARRAKMVKDFFSGTFSDSNGQPVAV